MPTVRIEPKTKIWLKFNGQKFRLPVNPKELNVNEDASSDNFTILGFGQINIPQQRNLMKVTFSSFFPGNLNDPYTFAESKKPKYYVDIIQDAFDNVRIGRLIIKRPGRLHLNIRVTIKSFKTTDTGGEPLDMPYNIELSEYRSFKPEKVVIKKKKVVENNSEKEKKVATKKKQRAVDTPVMRVGATVIANGTYCYDSYGSKPHGTAKNLTIQVKRIVPDRAYPILIGDYGWIKESCLQIKS